ncbi:MAG TPA: tetratricopeptide repeat protein [Vicinamibacteria bacterium]|nr:tetratricopeptide repeat protein [Vicinamibacteria bacterium]
MNRSWTGNRPLALAALVVWAVAAPAAAQTAGDPESEFNAGLMHLRENRPAMALDAFKKAASKDPKNPYIQKGLGVACLRLNKFDDAVSAFRKALVINPYYVDVRNDLGTALMLSGKRAEGKKEFLTAFNDPTNPTPDLSARNLGQAYLEEKNFPEAANWFRSSLGRNKALVAAYSGLADSLVGQGRPEEAIPPLEAGLKEVPGNAELLLTLGDLLYRAGRLSEAKGKLEEAVRLDPVGPAGKRAGDLLKQFK